jgi:glycine cleavage system protein P-like pyridoxal-binding family
VPPYLGCHDIEPTESESKREVDRFITAMVGIHSEIQKVISGEWDKDNNPLKNAPHTALEMAGDWVNLFFQHFLGLYLKFSTRLKDIKTQVILT